MADPVKLPEGSYFSPDFNDLKKEKKILSLNCQSSFSTQK